MLMSLFLHNKIKMLRLAQIQDLGANHCPECEDHKMNGFRTVGSTASGTTFFLSCNKCQDSNWIRFSLPNEISDKNSLLHSNYSEGKSG
jgi:formate dehydrogenase maturation protein FdhE